MSSGDRFPLTPTSKSKTYSMQIEAMNLAWEPFGGHHLHGDVCSPAMFEGAIFAVQKTPTQRK